MFIGVMKEIGIFYYWTWYLWPFIFTFSLVQAISLKIKDKNSWKISSIAASASLLIILAGAAFPSFH